MSSSRPPPPPRLLDHVRQTLRRKHYSLHTERTYTDWITHFILYHGKHHPRDLGRPELEAFLTHLAVDLNVAVSTQNQALSALLFLYQEVLLLEIDLPLSPLRAKRPIRLPTVLSKEEVMAALRFLPLPYQLMGSCSTAAACASRNVSASSKQLRYPDHPGGARP